MLSSLMQVRMTVSMVAPFGGSAVKYSVDAPVTIHYPVNSFLERHRQRGAQSEKARRLPTLADLPDLRARREIKMVAMDTANSSDGGPVLPMYAQSTGTPSRNASSAPSTPFMPSTPQSSHSRTRATASYHSTGGAIPRQYVPPLYVLLSNNLNVASSSRRIAMHCPYWLVNVTSMPLQVRDGNSKLPTLVPSFQVHRPSHLPALFTAFGAESIAVLAAHSA